MNQKLVDEFNKKLESIDEELTLEIITKEMFEIKYGNETIFTMQVISGVPVTIVKLDQPVPVVFDKDGLESFGNIAMLCGQYLEAFFGDSLCDD